MPDQDQQVESGAQAVQAGRDIIYRGMSSEQMMQIMTAMADQLVIYRSVASEIAQRRCDELRNELIEKFATGRNANPEAFKDPDFQYMVTEAHKAYARSGDGAVRDTLVDVIARRSLETERNRMAITLDEAAIRVPLFGRNEFAALSLAYLVRHTRNVSVNNFNSFCEYINTNFMPFVSDITDVDASY